MHLCKKEESHTKKWRKGRKKDKREIDEEKDKDKKKRDAMAQANIAYLSQLLLPSLIPSACPWLR
jgi:hypothetical protein